MRALVSRRVTEEELLSLIQRRLPKRYHVKLEDLHDAYMEYEEEGETILTITEEYDIGIVRRLLSPKMSELIDLIRKERLSIAQIAARLNRSTSNVYKDIRFLIDNKLAYLLRKGRARIPTLLLESIEVKV